MSPPAADILLKASSGALLLNASDIPLNALSGRQDSWMPSPDSITGIFHSRKAPPAEINIDLPGGQQPEPRSRGCSNRREMGDGGGKTSEEEIILGTRTGNTYPWCSVLRAWCSYYSINSGSYPLTTERTAGVIHSRTIDSLSRGKRNVYCNK